MPKNDTNTLTSGTEPDELTTPQKRSLQRIIWRYIWSTFYFWVPALVFLGLANEVRDNEPLPGDATILTRIHSVATPTLDKTFEFITTLGSAPVVIAAVGIASATLWYLKRRRDALFLLFCAGGTAAINVVFKLIFSRQRPDLWQHLVIEDGYSFPSGHAMISSALALAVIILLWRTKYRWTAVIVGTIYTLLVGLSRLYLGVHFPSDVIGGWCVSILWVITLHQVIVRYQDRYGRRKDFSNSSK